MDVIDELVETRRKSGQTQKDLAKTIGITREALAYFETRQKKPSYATLCRWCYCLGVRLTIVNDLFNHIEKV